MPLVNGDRTVRLLAALPKSWKSRPLKYEVQINMRTIPESSHPTLEFHYIDISSVDPDGNFGPLAEMTFENAPSRARRVPRTGDTVVSTVRTYLKAIGYIEESPQRRICSTGFAVLTPGPSLHPRFLFYWVRSEHFVDEICARSVGVSYPGINASEIGNLPVPLLLPEHQRAIADFLDRKTAVIDAIIRKKERLIELLQEKRQALITRMVTEGLNATARMKDSGIDWLGEIPAHWELTRLGYIARVVRGASPRPAGDQRYFHGDHSAWITVGELTKDDRMYLDETETFLTESGRQLSRVVPAWTLLLTNSGATLGVPKITRLAGCINDGSVAFLNLSEDVCREYLYYYLASLTRNYRERLRQGAGQPNLNTELVRSTPFPCPSLPEQQAVVTAIGAICQRLDVVRGRTEKQVDKLREYRQALISAAVTGKIDVRAEAAA